MSAKTGFFAKVQLLGPVTLEIPGRVPRGLPAQLRKVLAMLALTREVPLSAQQIVRRVWDGDPPDSAIQMVRNQIRTLRQSFGREVVQRSHGGYRLSAHGVEIDAEVFRGAVQEGRALRSSGDLAGAVRTLQRGLGLWRGPDALVDVRDVPDLDVAAVGLEELRFQAEEMVVDGHLALDNPQDALPILRSMTALHPSREVPWLQLMAAQALSGRRIEASGETYRLAQHHLVEKTGLDAPLLARVHQALLRGIHGRELVTMIRSAR
jgi:DNA-binding SARP family transcriptional activator